MQAIEQREEKIGNLIYVFRRVVDPDPDPSYLEQEGWEERLEEFRKGDFYFVGVICEILIRTKVVGQASLWGIESDSDEEYFDEIEEELKSGAEGDMKGLKEALGEID